MNSLLNWLSVYKDHLQSSKKFILVSSIGLIFIVAIFSTSFIYINSIAPTLYASTIVQDKTSLYQHNAAGFDAFPDFSPSPFDINIYSDIANGKQQSIVTDSVISALNTTINSDITALGFGDKISSIPFFSFLYGPTINITTLTLDTNITQTVPTYVPIYQLSPVLRQELQLLMVQTDSKGLLPAVSNTSQAILLHPNIYNSRLLLPQSHSSTIITTMYSPSNNDLNATPLWENKSITITGSLDVSRIFHSQFPVLVDTIENYYYGTGLLVSPPQYFLFVNNLTNFLQQIVCPPITSYTCPAHLVVHTGINLNYQKLNPYNANKDSLNLAILATQLEHGIYTTISQLGLISYFGVDANFQSSSVFTQVFQQIQFYSIILYMLGLPLIIIALFMANYSFGLISRTVKRNIGMYKSRGTSVDLLSSLLLCDLVLIIGISTIFGFIAGLIMTLIITHSNDLLSLTNWSHAPGIVFDTTSVNNIAILIFLASIFGLLIQVRRINQLSKMTVIETDEPSENKEPYWKQHGLDLWLFGVGGAILVLAYLSFTQLPGLAIFFYFLVYPGIILFILGIILVLNRVLPSIMARVSRFCWNRIGGTLAFSFKTIVRYRQASTRAVILIIVVITAFMVLVSVPYSYELWSKESLTYNLGAEGVGIYPATNGNFYNQTLITLLETNYSQYLSGITPFLKLYYNTEHNTPNYFFAINTSTFLDVAQFPVSPTTQYSLTKDIQDLAKPSSSPYVLVNSQYLRYAGVSINSSITLFSQQGTIYNYQILDTFENWPRFFYPNDNTGSSLNAVMSIAPFLQNNFDILKSGYQILESGIYFNFRAGVNQSMVAQWISENNPLSITLVSSQYSTEVTNSMFVFGIGQINGDIILVLLMGIVISILFLVQNFIERKREFFTEISFGIHPNQLFLQLILEAFILVGIGIILGSITGMIFCQLITIFLNLIMVSGFLPRVFPYYASQYPFNLIFEFSIFFVFLSIVSAGISAWNLMRQDINSSFIGE